jgi:ribonuclease R
MTKTGIFIGNANGYGFIAPSSGGKDLFVPPGKTGAAIHGDTVAYRVNAKITDEARVTEIIKRGKPTFVGTYVKGQIIPMDKKIPYIFTPSPKSKARFALVDGHRVLFSVKKNEPVYCTVTELLGHVNDPGIDVLSLVNEYHVPYIFPPDTLEEAGNMPQTIDTENRLDLRDALIFTLDGEDTKDIDDAISLEITDGGYTLGVHIADVAHYVKEGSALDREARKRGNSVYLADRVIPMLPHVLSNGLCSLNPGEDKLAVSCIMALDGNGNITGHKIVPSVIRNKYRFTYERVQALLDRAAPAEEENIYLPILQNMNRLRKILAEKRVSRGALNFNLPETKIRADEAGRPLSVEAYVQNEATGLIEEFMIVCNETVAAHFDKLNVPFLYRVHEPPEPEKIKQLRTFLKELRIKWDGSGFNALLERVKDEPYAYAVTQSLLRSQQQARYSPVHDRHFGLASECYSHFTSPIRRYADLQIHRIIKASFSQQDTRHFKALLPEVGSHCSATERTAEALERAVNQLKKAQYMLGKEGQIFEGTVSGIERWGVYVMLENTVEGLIPAERIKRIPKRNRPLYRVGDNIMVRLAWVDTDEMKINFKPVKGV